MERLEVLGLKDSKDEMPGVGVDNDDDDDDEGGEVVVEDSRSTGGHGRRSKEGRSEVLQEAAGGRGQAGEEREEEGSEEVGDVGDVGDVGAAGGDGGRLVEEVEVVVKAGGDWTRSPYLWSELLSVWPSPHPQGWTPSCWRSWWSPWSPSRCWRC